MRKELIRGLRVEIESGFRNFVPLRREPRLEKEEAICSPIALP